MRDPYSYANTHFDDLFCIREKVLPSSPMTDPQYFLSTNEGVIIQGLNDSCREHRRIVYSKLSAAFGVFAAVAMLFTFSRGARAFAKDVFYTVIEWFSPENHESGVEFNIETNEQTVAPSTTELISDEKTCFGTISETDKLYNHNFCVLNDSAFTFSDGYMQNDTICLNFLMDNVRIQLISEPIQNGGSVNYHFNADDFSKVDVPSLGMLYYNLTDGTLFGGIMTNSTNIIMHIPDHASPELLELIVRSISLYH